MFLSNLWRKLILYAYRDSQDMVNITALVRCVYEHIKTALASHGLQCCLRIRRVCRGRRTDVGDIRI